MIFFFKAEGRLFHGVIVTEIVSGSFHSFIPVFGNGCYAEDKQGKPSLIVPLCKTANAPIHGFLLPKSLKNLNLDVRFTSVKVCGSESKWCFQMQFTECDPACVTQTLGAKGGAALSPASSTKAAFLSPSKES